MALPMLGGEGGPWQKPTVEARNKDGRHPPVLVLPTRRWGGDFSRQSQTSTGPQRATRETFPICRGKSSRSEGNCVHRTDRICAQCIQYRAPLHQTPVGGPSALAPLCAAPGGDSGAVPTSMATRAGTQLDLSPTSRHRHLKVLE